MARAEQLWSRLGIRRQLTLVAVALVALPLCLAVFVLANLLARSLSNALDSSASDLARRAASLVAEQGPDALPGDLEPADGYRVQVLSASGTVQWSSSARWSSPLTDLRPSPGQVQREGALLYWGPGDDEQPELVVAEGVSHGQTHHVVVVAASQASQLKAVDLTAALLLSAVPLVMLVAGLLTWWLVGRALRPVAEMTDDLSRISSTIEQARVPVPVAEDEVRRLGTAMNEMLDRLQAVQRSQRSFVSDASHELRSPVASLSGAIEIARHADDLATWRELAPLMAAETHRLEQLVKGMLNLSRADDSGLTLNLVEVDLDDLAGEEVARLRSTSGLQVSQAISPARVVADPAQLRQLLVNLGDNAVRHARSQVLVTVLQTGEGGALLQVDDDGAGVPEADRERVFDRFVRLEESRNRDHGGSGLGLAIVAQIVRAHRGHVEVLDSRLGGAAFVVHLPQRRREAASD